MSKTSSTNLAAEQELFQFLDEHKITREQLEQERAKKIQARENARTTARREFLKWKEEGIQAQLGAAKEIIQWVKAFLASRAWTKIRETVPYEEVRISKVIQYSFPSPYHKGEPDKDSQYLYIDQTGKLFVHDCHKYGKSHDISTKELLLEHTAHPVIKKIAETITDGTILKFIAKELAASLTRKQPKNSLDW